MATQLYREGDTHDVRGYPCEVQNFDPVEVPMMLEEGWVMDPSELEMASQIHDAAHEERELKELSNLERAEEKAAEAARIEREAVEAQHNVELKNKEIRAAAKEAGIDGYEKKRIATLVEELNAK